MWYEHNRYRFTDSRSVKSEKWCSKYIPRSCRYVQSLWQILQHFDRILWQFLSLSGRGYVHHEITDFLTCSSAAASGWAGWALAHPEFESSVNPITTRGADYAHHITASPPGFENPAASLLSKERFIMIKWVFVPLLRLKVSPPVVIPQSFLPWILSEFC